MSAVPIAPELAAFLESGISALVGSRDARLQPDCVRAVGARIEAGGEEVTVFLPVATAAATVANLRDNGHIAFAVSRPADHRSLQLKGRVLEIRDADAVDRRQVERYRSELVTTWGFVGIPPRLTLRMAHWPCHAVRFRVESVFVQTPGPGAGAPLAGAGDAR